MNEPTRAIWLRRIGDHVQVLVESDDSHEWRIVMEESFDSIFSHIWEGRDLKDKPFDPLTHGKTGPKK